MSKFPVLQKLTHMRVCVRTPTCPCSLTYVNIGHHNTLDLVNNKYHQEPTYMVFGTQCVDEYKDGLILHMMTTNSIIPTAHVSWH